MPDDHVLHVSTPSMNLYYDAMGACHTASSGGRRIDECVFENNGPRVQLHLSPTSSEVPPLDQREVAVREKPETPADAYSWQPERGSDVTLTFQVPTGSSTYGWKFTRASLPTPLAIKVRVKRPT